MFSQTVEYALRAIVCLGQSDQGPLTTSEIAARTQVPAGYLSKVLQLLNRARLIDATRGLHGGHALAVPPDKLCLLQVVNAIDPLKRIERCPLSLKTHGEHLCPLHRRLDNVLADAERAFAETSVADLLADPTRSQPLCESE